MVEKFTIGPEFNQKGGKISKEKLRLLTQEYQRISARNDLLRSKKLNLHNFKSVVSTFEELMINILKLKMLTQHLADTKVKL